MLAGHESTHDKLNARSASLIHYWPNYFIANEVPPVFEAWQ